jgi:tetraprenyl-beta-curcumene synthase
MFRSITAPIASLTLMVPFISRIFPLVKRELAIWEKYAQQYAGPELSSQALASIRDKKFHCLGGNIYSLYPGVDAPALVRLITALQTISDYLDNLCDRAGIIDEAAFRQLHLAMTDALDPASQIQDYYQHYPFRKDGGYLEKLVQTCQEEVARLPAYAIVKPYVLKLATLYSHLQIYKHLDPALREEKLRLWIEPQLLDYPQISVWEFAAATGSTLGIFSLCAAAAKPALQEREAQQIFTAYFPWICGLHILQDYLIDQAEDVAGGDLNFTTYYHNEQEMTDRLIYWLHKALEYAYSAPYPHFTATIVHGLPAMYLSDPKAAQPSQKAVTAAILKAASLQTRLLYQLCRLLRRIKSL